MTWEAADLAVALRSRYRIFDELGRGTCGVVYRAEQVSLSRPVALKVLVPEGVADFEFLLERFPVEARAAARISHPNVVKIYDHDVLPGALAYIAYEFVEGCTLASLVAMGPVQPVARARRLAADLAAGAAALHRAGIVHRDIKPANVLVDREGVARLIDLGLARDVVDQSHLTRTGMFLGTPAYTSPEYLTRAELSPASDVYALGVIFYEFLTGRRPFTDLGLQELAVAHATRDPVPPGDVQNGADPLLCELALAALAKDPAARPDAEGLATALASSASAVPKGRSRRAPGPSSAGRRRLPERAVEQGDAALPRPSRLRALVVGATAAALVVVLVLAVRPGLHTGERPAVPTRQPSAPSPALSPDNAQQDRAAAEVAVAVSEARTARPLVRSRPGTARPALQAALRRAVRAYESLPVPHRRRLWATTGKIAGFLELVRIYCASLDDDPELERREEGLGSFLARAARNEADTPLYHAGRGLYRLVESARRARLAPEIQADRLEAFHDLYLGLNLALQSAGAEAGPIVEAALALTRPRHEWRRRSSRASETEWPLWRVFHAHAAAPRPGAPVPAALPSQLAEALEEYHRKLDGIGAAIQAPPPPDWGRHLSGVQDPAAVRSRERLEDLAQVARDPERWRSEITSAALSERMEALLDALRPLDSSVSTPVLEAVEEWLASAAAPPRGPAGYWLARVTWLLRIGRGAEARVAALAGLEVVRHMPGPPAGLVQALHEGLLDSIPPAESGEAGEPPEREQVVLDLQQATVAASLADFALREMERSAGAAETLARARVWEARLLARAGHEGLATRSRGAARAALTAHAARLGADVVTELERELDEVTRSGPEMKPTTDSAILPEARGNR